MTDIDIEIDGQPLKAKPNSMVIQVADDAGIYIPRFCYHKLLSVAANCRMCLVEVEKSPKPLPACATPVMPGMKVFTRSQKALAAQRAVMEFLLINHPLDCPICDQGGECELQDLSMGFGGPKSYFHEGKRSVKDKNIGPLIATEMTRCIQCTRCVRFGDEVAGLRELGATGRGENMEIGTYVQHAMHSEVSGNIIDLCPVGALTSKPFRFTARAWELNQYPSIAAHDCVGSNINIHTRNGRVMRVVPRENLKINETWISDRDRYSYEGLYHADRIKKPMIREGSGWQETDWQTAFTKIALQFGKILNKNGPESIGALVSPNATLEEFYLLQKIMRSIGCNNIDHRLRQVDFTDQAYTPNSPGLSDSIANLESYERVILIGSNIQKEQPSLALRLRKASLKGMEIISLNMLDYRFHFKLIHKRITAPHQFVDMLARLVKALDEHSDGLNAIRTDDEDRLSAEYLRSSKKTAVLFGALALNHNDAAMIRALGYRLAQITQGSIHFLTEGANSRGGYIAGAIPHRLPGGKPLEKPGYNAKTMLENSCKGYFLLNVEPDLDCANPVSLKNALYEAECVVALSMFRNSVLEETAHVILPMTPFTETSGTFVNVEGTWQSFQGVAKPFGEARPAWKILRVLGNILHLDGFEYSSSEEVLQELKNIIPTKIEEPTLANMRIEFRMHTHEGGFSRIGEIPLYSTDSLVRRARALQATQIIIEGELTNARLNPDDALSLGFKEGDIIKLNQEYLFPVAFDARVPKGGILIAGGMAVFAELPELFGTITIEKV